MKYLLDELEIVWDTLYQKCVATFIHKYILYICMSHRVFPLSYEGFEFSKAVVESRRSSSSRKRGGSCASSRSGYGLYGSACRIKTREDELLQQYVCK
jgi:hypothetical protein